jgi:membrane-associated phospholipid phosphatase
MVAGLAVAVAMTRFWKISIHTAVAAGTATSLVITFGPAMLATSVIVLATGWSRVRLRDHTPLQGIVGAFVGAVVAAAVYVPLR